MGDYSGPTDSTISTSFTSLGQAMPPMESPGGIDISMDMNINTGFVATSSGRDQFLWSNQFGIHYPNGDIDLLPYGMLVCIYSDTNTDL